LGQKKIEFIGDSDTTAYGNLAPKTGVDLAGLADGAQGMGKGQDIERGWAAMTSRAFQADGEFIAILGTGAKWDDMGSESNLEQYYRRPCYCYDTIAQELDPVDLVVVYLGGNDVMKIKKDMDAFSRKREFIAAYVALLKTVKKYRPNTPILCVAPGPSLPSAVTSVAEQKQASALLQEMIPKAVAQAGGDAQGITFGVNPATMDLSDNSLWGSIMHWSAKAHVRTAEGAIPLIKAKMGWEEVQGWKTWPAQSLVNASTRSI
jgi:lysophospholipase L1-like esterase